MSLWTQHGGPTIARKRLALVCLCVALPVLSLGYQIAAKQTALDLSEVPFGWVWFARLVHLHWAWALLAFEIASFAAWMTALSEMKLSAAFPMSAIGYVLIILTSWVMYREPASAAQVAGGAMILAGIWQIGRATPDQEDAP
ncbi:MAG: transporter [Phenylobacterium sp.]|uniref:SMR family transporter n=1 Tax=Phenylobacterium sp. TaxID=1871053 RepID=UPI0025FE4AF2|nr:SMR family transporter [Phenylobacterium sp.]MBT9470834.1 transporter [Phenylobacterium sp.]